MHIAAFGDIPGERITDPDGWSRGDTLKASSIGSPPNETPIALAIAMTLVTSVALTGTSSAAQKRLGYTKAKHAIQAKAHRFAQTQTRITSMFRLGDVTWSGRAEWKRENPTGCVGCGFDPVTGDTYDTPTTEACSIGLRAKQLHSGQVRVSTEDFACY